MKQLFYTQGETQSTEQPWLSFRIGPKHCLFAITNSGGTQLNMLAYYELENKEWDPYELAGRHPEIKNPFEEILVGFDYLHQTFVPTTKFQESSAPEMLRLVTGAGKNEVVLHEPIREWDMFNVYSIPANIHGWFRNQYPNAKRLNQFTIGLNQAIDSPGGYLQADFRKEEFTVLLTTGKKLLIAQTYEYSTPADVLYYLLRIVQQFGLLQQEVRLHLSGLIDKESALYRELYQYFIHIDFREADWEGGDNFPSHFFTSLNDLLKCAS